MVRSTPGRLLRGAAIFGLVSWAAILFLLTRIPGIEGATYASALAMAGLFVALLAGQNAAEIRLEREEVAARTLFRRMRCPIRLVDRVEVKPFLPGITVYLLCTRRGPFAFSSLWRRHRELVEALAERQVPVR